MAATLKIQNLRGTLAPTQKTIQTSLKTALIVLIVILGQQYLEFPGSTIASFYAVVFGLIPNLGQVYLRGKSGVAGVALALIYGFAALWLLVNVPVFPVLIGLFSLGVFVSVFIATGSERMAYGGIQAALIMSFIFLLDSFPIHQGTGLFAAYLDARPASLLWPRSSCSFPHPYR